MSVFFNPDTGAFPNRRVWDAFNENRDAVKPIVMIEIKDGGQYAVKERVNVEGATAVNTTPAAPAAPVPAKTANQ